MAQAWTKEETCMHKTTHTGWHSHGTGMQKGWRRHAQHGTITRTPDGVSIQRNAIRHLANNSDMNHADLSGKAHATARIASAQALRKPAPSDTGTQEAPTTHTADTHATSEFIITNTPNTTF